MLYSTQPGYPQPKPLFTSSHEILYETLGSGALKTAVAERENLDRAHPSYSLGKANANLKFPAFPEIGHRK